MPEAQENPTVSRLRNMVKKTISEYFEQSFQRRIPVTSAYLQKLQYFDEP
jgi:hypothetical protein